MRDVRERPAVHQRRIVFHRLHEVGLEGISQQCSHGALRIEFADRHRLVLTCVAENDIAEAVLEIGKTRRQTEDRHDLGGHGNVESRLAHDAVVKTAETRSNSAQRAIVHIDDPPPRDAARVDIELVLPVHVIVDQC